MSKPMSQFLRKTLLFRASSHVSLQNPNFSSPRLRWFSVASEDEKTNSFVVSYLKNSLGFSYEMALSASKHVKFDTPDRPDKAIEFLRSYGFSETQISKLVRTYPWVLLSDTEKTILPKLEFLKSKGVSEPEFAKMLPLYPNFLKSSLSNKIIPSYDHLRSILKCDKRTINVVRQHPDILCFNLNYVVSNCDILREHGVSDAKIASCLERNQRAFASHPDRFRAAVEKVAKMGFDTSRGTFATALIVSLSLSESTWESKVDTLRRCGFSEDEASKLFRGNPYSMQCSERKILATMEFFAGEMSWRPSLLVKFPLVFGLSVKKRIIPRCMVYKALLEKGLVSEKKINLNTLLIASEERFLKKYVNSYENDGPELLELYQEKLNSL